MSSTAVTGPAAGPAAAVQPAPGPPRVGMLPPFDLLGHGPGAARAFLAQAAEAGIDHICCGAARRFAAAVEMAAQEAARAGRPGPLARHAMQVWCGLADSKQDARACLAPAMEAFYQIPFERFERYCPYGTADDVAEFLAPYAAAGCVEFNLVPRSPDDSQALAGAAAVKRLLARA
jgi:alkanesulfonate monooxygenase SsuD/methylene tetrahydromethanopterin reductase-like flavin-dependent oxidoreductase (luciferase family)